MLMASNAVAHHMGTRQFLFQDVAGNVHAACVTGHAPGPQGGLHSTSHTEGGRHYRLEDGAILTRVDDVTFQMAGTGAYLTLLRD